MNRFLALAALLVVSVIAGCKKGGDDDPTIPPPPTDPLFSYSVDGVRDTSVGRVGEVQLRLTVRHLSGKAETVKLNAADLPNGVTASFNPQTGLPPFTSFLTLASNKTPEGTYTIYVTDSAKGKSGVTSRPLKLTVKPYLNAAEAFNGQYTESHSCSQSGASAFPVYIEPVEKFVNRIIIKGFWTKSWSMSVYADLDPDNKTVNVPLQNSNGITFQGLGTFNDDGLMINYTVTDSSTVVSESCTATFEQ